MEHLLRITEVADRLGLGRTTVYALIQRGDLASVRIGGSRRVRESDLLAFMASLDAVSP